MKPSQTGEKILAVLFEFPTRRFHIRELARILKISPPAIGKAAHKLEQEKIVTVKRAVVHEVAANLENEVFKHRKRVYNLSQIYESGLFNCLKEQFPLAEIILFGSYARGEDGEKSDIDIAILDSAEKKIILESYEKLLKRAINLEFIKMKNCSKELKNSIINGIPLQGYIEL